MGRKKEYSQEELTQMAKTLLNEPFWISDLNIGESYTRLHDDHDGTYKGVVAVTFYLDGDAMLYTTPARLGGELRFRTQIGGGQSERVRTALMILALAIKMDNESRPQEIPT